jgi:glutathione synthase/RimK-type ligase-like ATP-grasp enzyme
MWQSRSSCRRSKIVFVPISSSKSIYAIRSLGKFCEIVDTTRLLHATSPEVSIEVADNGLGFGRGLFSLEKKCIWGGRLFHNKHMSGAPADFEDYIYNESVEFEQNLFKCLENDGGTRWINKISSVRSAEFKSYQLGLAAGSGLRVPRTLISADPASIRRFCRGIDRVVVKPFSPHTWHDELNKKRTTTFANIVGYSQIEQCNDADLGAAPCIFQEYVSTRSDVRVGIMGDKLFALEMQHQVQGKIDFRAIEKDDLAFRKIDVPSDVANGLRSLMQSLDVVIASADFVLDRSGCWHFIELNPSGAFLFLEERCPDISILSAMASLFHLGAVVDDHAEVFPCLASFVRSKDHEDWLAHKKKFDERNRINRHVTYLNAGA